ncbi:hypothetical protein [Acidithrix ferrooxidans]|uniref:Uncharacterized protein n=1 Tax=Acidithrix ferrooxidans TaxID=1280514 RepID=A0A0D8HGE8_9ACTN|nr:hypothetical protein [Acidithrix ferrooxidans]KJF16161.1 hypothetical protein AXFE_30090 [Acidithrix ferrooxidans]
MTRDTSLRLFPLSRRPKTGVLHLILHPELFVPLSETVDMLKHILSFTGASLLCSPSVIESVIERRLRDTQLKSYLPNGSISNLYKFDCVTFEQ